MRNYGMRKEKRNTARTKTRQGEMNKQKRKRAKHWTVNLESSDNLINEELDVIIGKSLLLEDVVEVRPH